jgi:hypothetical protein
MTLAVRSAAPHRLVHQFALHPQRRPFTQINTCSVGELFLFFIFYCFLNSQLPAPYHRLRPRIGAGGKGGIVEEQHKVQTGSNPEKSYFLNGDRSHKVNIPGSEEVSWTRAESQRGRKGRAPDVMGTFALGSSFDVSD